MRCIVFDLDDTLYLERDYVRSGFTAVDEWLQDHAGLAQFYNVAWDLFERGTRGNIFDLALKSLPVRADAALIQTMVSVYREHSPQIMLQPDAESILMNRPRDTVYCLITDGPAKSQQAKLRALRLGKFIEHTVVTDLWGSEYWKPHVRGFKLIEELTGCSGNECTYIGDNPGKDFTAPKQLHWRSVRIRREQGLHYSAPNCDHASPDLEIATLTDLARECWVF